LILLIKDLNQGLDLWRTEHAPGKAQKCQPRYSVGQLTSGAPRPDLQFFIYDASISVPYHVFGTGTKFDNTL